MSPRQILSNSSPTKSFSLIPEPAAAWTAILVLSFLTAAFIVAGAGKILNLAFPAGALAVGVFLYFRYPILYNGFTWWIWFLIALVRRLADYRSSYTEPSPLLLAPYLVMGVTLVTVWQHLPKAHRQEYFPFVLPLIGVFYGFLIGLIIKSPFDAVRGTLDWLAPLSYGFHLAVNWRNYPSYRQNFQRTFLWGILVMGIYGIVQFVAMPEWDRLWLINSGMDSASGNPDESIRIWSTMHSGEPFAAVMAGGLLLLFSYKGAFTLPSSVVGYLAFLLSMVRSAWLGWLAGIFILTGSLKAKYQMRLIVVILVMAVCVVPLATMDQFSEMLGTRLATLSNVGEDDSATGRQEAFKNTIGVALTKFVGEGIGRETMDNAILATLFYLGWLGTLPYLGGMLLLVFKLFYSSEGSFDLFAAAARAIVISVLIRLPVNGAQLGPSGALLWGCLGIGLAARKYYHARRVCELSRSLPQISYSNQSNLR